MIGNFGVDKGFRLVSRTCNGHAGISKIVGAVEEEAVVEPLGVLAGAALGQILRAGIGKVHPRCRCGGVRLVEADVPNTIVVQHKSVLNIRVGVVVASRPILKPCVGGGREHCRHQR